METNNFKVSSNGHCKASKEAPDQKAIQIALASTKKKHKENNLVIIARYKWLLRNKIAVPKDMELPNLCLMVKHGKLVRAFFSNVMTHVIKKQNYYIQVLNE